MRRILTHNLTIIIFLSFILLILSFVKVNISIVTNAEDRIMNNAEELQAKETALLLGALVYPDGRLGTVLQDRADSTLALYKAGKIDYILVSGDNGSIGYDEVNPTKKYLVANGVDPQRIYTDNAGFDTYDSIVRAQEIFGVENMVIVTNEFHLPRALYIADSIGIDAIGYKSDIRVFDDINRRNAIRELFARIKSYVDIKTSASPTLLGKQILIGEDLSSESWSSKAYD